MNLIFMRSCNFEHSDVYHTCQEKSHKVNDRSYHKIASWKNYENQGGYATCQPKKHHRAQNTFRRGKLRVAQMKPNGQKSIKCDSDDIKKGSTGKKIDNVVACV